MEQLDEAVTIQEKLCDVPHEKLKSLQEKREIYSCLNLTDSSAQELQKKLEQCQEEMTREKKVNNIDWRELWTWQTTTELILAEKLAVFLQYDVTDS